MSEDFSLEYCTNDAPRSASSESHEERRKRRWRERLKRWKRKFTPEQLKEKLRRYSEAYRKRNPERMKQHRKNWEIKNPDKVKERHRRFSKKRYLRKREEYLAKHKEYYKENRDRILGRVKEYYANNRETRLTYLKKWQREHPEKNVEQNAKRRALELAAMGNLVSLKEFVRSTKSKRTVVCYYCQKRFSSKKLHFDHIIPLSKGGAHSVDNLCVSCPKCNRSKHARFIASFKIDGQQMLNL